jgi:hypothetical protein
MNIEIIFFMLLVFYVFSPEVLQDRFAFLNNISKPQKQKYLKIRYSLPSVRNLNLHIFKTMLLI